MVYVGNDNKTFNPLADKNDTVFPLNVYRDVNATKEDRPLPLEYQDIWRVDNITLPPIGVLGAYVRVS